jgi:serine/threonine protein kinase
MPAPTTTSDLVALIRRSRLVEDDRLDSYASAAETPADVLKKLQDDGLLTPFQADQLLRGRHKGFVLGKYKLLDRIGMGGMGQVYLAEHVTMRRRVAVKVLPPDRSGSPFARERFLREARAAAAVEHPNLIRVYDIEHDGDVYFLVMEYIDGVSLHDLVSRRGPLTPERAAHYVAQVALGLNALHERALVHRDIKPANLLLDRAGIVRILDLGLVRSELDDDELTRQEGAKLIGTADYLAPEQALHCSKVDSRADLYGLGGTTYFLLTGQPPFAVAKLSQKLIAHQVQEVKPVHLIRPDVPVELSAVIQKMLEKRPEERYQSAVEVVAALQPWLTSSIPLPEEADFPVRPVGGAAPSAALSFANRLSGTSLSLTTTPRPAAPLSSGVSGGSAIRFTLDPNQSGAGKSAGNQPTTAMAADDTGTGHSATKSNPPQPVVVTIAELSGRASRPEQDPVIELTQPATKKDNAYHAEGTAERIDTLFLDPEPKSSKKRGLLRMLDNFLTWLFGRR